MIHSKYIDGMGCCWSRKSYEELYHDSLQHHGITTNLNEGVVTAYALHRGEMFGPYNATPLSPYLVGTMVVWIKYYRKPAALAAKTAPFQGEPPIPKEAAVVYVPVQFLRPDNDEYDETDEHAEKKKVAKELIFRCGCRQRPGVFQISTSGPEFTIFERDYKVPSREFNTLELLVQQVRRSNPNVEWMAAPTLIQKGKNFVQGMMNQRKKSKTNTGLMVPQPERSGLLSDSPVVRSVNRDDRI
jgi:hypothetical protein